MVVILEADSGVPLYKSPSLKDVNLITYCEINNINYSTVRSRIRRGWTVEKAVTSTPSNYVDYRMKEGDKNGV